MAATAWLLLAAGSGPSTAGLLCTAETARNESTGQLLQPPAPVFHPRGQLREDGDFYVRSESSEDTDGSTEIEHRIHRRTGSFETVAMQTVHSVGEQYMIRTTGSCTPADHVPLAPPARY